MTFSEVGIWVSVVQAHKDNAITRVSRKEMILFNAAPPYLSVSKMLLSTVMLILPEPGTVTTSLLTYFTDAP